MVGADGVSRWVNSAVPTGLSLDVSHVPTAEAVGYLRASLRDGAWMCFVFESEIHRARDRHPQNKWVAKTVDSLMTRAEYCWKQKRGTVRELVDALKSL